jgi:hypothetical protein
MSKIRTDEKAIADTVSKVVATSDLAREMDGLIEVTVAWNDDEQEILKVSIPMKPLKQDRIPNLGKLVADIEDEVGKLDSRIIIFGFSGSENSIAEQD